jgi:adenylosuccinate synthase
MVTVVVGSQWGDEGKGKIVDYLSQKADYVVRFHGGAGAGHTLVNQYGTFKLHQIPSGIFHKNTICVIANGVVVDPKELIEEIKGLEKVGINVKKRLLISPRAQVVFDYHKTLDGIFDEAKGSLKTATTRRGNGPVHADKVSYHGIKLYDLIDPKMLAIKLKSEIQIKNKIIEAFGGEKFDYKKILSEYLALGKKLKPYFANTFEILNDAIDKKKNVLFEGAHGIFLDNDWGTYPYVTASSILPSNIGAGAGVNPKKIDEIIGIVRVYLTRVDTGACPMPTEMKGKLGDILREKAHEYGATTGRPRRIGWNDLVQVRFAAKLCGFTSLAITKPDILTKFKKISVCIGYKYRGKMIDYLDVDTEKLRQVKPVYKEFDGWDEDLTEIRDYQKLPPNCRKYIEFIEQFTHVPVKYISVGPRLEETIVKK